MPTTLQTLPPELLLHTISFLPSTTLLPLTRTSHHLHTFISAHASRICNTHINTHYPLEAAVLLPVLRPDSKGQKWLTPTLPGIAEMRDKYCSQQLGLFWDGVAEWGKMRLSEPGPQFLRFLELYGRDIRVRIAMELAAANIDEFQQREKPGHEKQGINEMGINEIVEKLAGNEKFEGAINMYCVAPFMSSIARSGHEFGIRDTSRTKRTAKIKNMKCNFRKKLQSTKEKMGQWWESDGGSETSLLFGEIQREKVGYEDERRQEGVAEGLVWYFGRTGVAPLGRERVVLGKFWKIRRCAKDAREGVRRTGKNVGRVVRRWRCLNGFEVLN